MLLKMFFKYFVLFGLENNKNFKRLHSENACVYYPGNWENPAESKFCSKYILE